ncbi:MAG: DEAD/DEAH box helicase [Rhizobiales bacterium]|nr:DEAD/DEAH box helicase [Hyphomicrobiales bacterium]
MLFSELGLSPKVLASVEAAGYTAPTPIQEQAIPHVLARRDVLGIAQTGTGKTAGFVLPMLNLLERGRARARMPRTLILEPTRELAAQVEEQFNKYGRNHKLNVALLIGGVSFDDQEKKLDRGVDVLIATPGRLLDHIGRGKVLLSGVEILVIDEADRMLDMGFIPDIERICKILPFTRQTLFFSATMPPEIQRLADQFLSNPIKVEASRPATTADTVSQYIVSAGREAADKRAVLRKLIREATDLTNAIVFCNRKRDVAILHRSLQRHGFNAGALHGDMDQRSRTQTLDDFRKDKLTLLIASDVAARGLDIPAVSHVFNFDVPTHSEDYVHRIGRTGRAGRSGTAITIVTSADKKYVAGIEKLIGKPIPMLEVEADDERAASRYARRGAPEGAEVAEASPEAPSSRPADDEDRSEGGERRGRRRRGRGRGDKPETATRAAEAPEPVRPAAPRRAENSGPVTPVPRREPRPERQPEPAGVDDDPSASLPFGRHGHVPDFLLRPVRTS